MEEGVECLYLAGMLASTAWLEYPYHGAPQKIKQFMLMLDMLSTWQCALKKALSSGGRGPEGPKQGPKIFLGMEPTWTLDGAQPGPWMGLPGLWMGLNLDYGWGPTCNHW